MSAFAGRTNVRKLGSRRFVVDSVRASAPPNGRGVVRLARTGAARCYRIPAGRELNPEGAAARPAMSLSDDERRTLAVLDQRLGRRILANIATIVTPDTTN